MMADKRVCIVGAGVAGLVTIKECKHVGLNPVCYELHSDYGGIWSLDRADKTSNSPWAWDSLITNTTKYVMTLSDFHPEQDIPMYMTRQALGEYYRSYAEHFHLVEHIVLNTRVVNIRKTADHDSTGRWEVFTCPTSEFRGGDKQAGKIPSEDELRRCTSEIFDVVIVCSGFFKVPIYPDIPGLKSFPGDVHHSFNYKSPEPFRGKRVLVVGNSFSAGDIACDISIHTDKRVDLSIGRGTWIQPRVADGGSSLDRAFTRKVLYGTSIKDINDIQISTAQRRLDHVGNGINPQLPPTKTPYIMGDDIFLKILSDQIRIQDAVVAFDESRAKFKDGAVSDEFDAVVLATGYSLDSSFVNLNYTREDGVLELYNMMLPIREKHHTLAFVGFLNGDGPPGVSSELQARYVSRLITGKIQPPTQKAMEANVEKLARSSLDRKGKLTYHISLFGFADDVAKDLGVYPDYWTIFFRDPRLAHMTWKGPMYTSHYRLLGPDSDWETARAACYRANEIMRQVPVSRGTVPVIREDVAAARRQRILLLVGGIALVLGLGYFGRSRNWNIVM